MTEVEVLKARIRDLEEQVASLEAQRDGLVVNMNALRAALVSPGQQTSGVSA